MIFAREINDNLTSLVKKVDAQTAKNNKLRSFVVLCNDDEKSEDKLKELAKKEKITKTVLTLVDKKSGPEEYDLDKDADVTVVLYVQRQVKGQYAYKKGEFKSKDVDAIIKDLPKIVSKGE
jgi:hypothetical protein